MSLASLEAPFTAVALVATLGYFVSLLLKDNSVADVIWGPQQVAIAAAAIWSSSQPFAWWQGSLLALLSLWAARLTLHIIARRALGGAKRKEDWRYAEMREHWGRAAWLHSLFKVFYLQGFMALILSLPVVAAIHRPVGSFALWQWIGLAAWGFGLTWEAIADWQLLAFKQRSTSGSIMRNGVWSYSRHPNYTGEILVWWGIYLFSESWMWWISPVLITYLLARVSGVPLAEKRYENNEEYAQYRRSTPALIPSFCMPFR